MPYFHGVRPPLLFRKNGIFDDKWHEYRFSSRSSLSKMELLLMMMLEMN